MKFLRSKVSLSTSILVIAAIILVAGFYLWALFSGSGFGSGKQMNGVKEEKSATQSEEKEGNYHPELSLQAFSEKEFDGRNLTLSRVLLENSVYTRYYITYKSGDLTISGVMNVPKGEGPFPVLILNHGYIDPDVYTNGRGLKREQNYLARNGYVVLHTDYRNHADSTKVESDDRNLRLGYAEDAANAVKAVRESDFEFVDKENIGMLGHSMGGGVSMKVMTAHPDLVDAVSLYAPVSADAYDNFNKWIRPRTEVAEEILNTHGNREENPEFWRNMSPINFLDKVEAPVILHHGTEDKSVPIEWSRKFVDAMKDAEKDITFHVYDDAPHEFISSWPLFMQRNVEFFDRHLKN